MPPPLDDLVNARNNYGQTPLHTRAENAATEVVRLFTRCGADVPSRPVREDGVGPVNGMSYPCPLRRLLNGI